MAAGRDPNKEKIGVWLTPEEKSQLNDAVEVMGYKNLADFIRDVAATRNPGLDHYLEASGNLRVIKSILDAECAAVPVFLKKSHHSRLVTLAYDEGCPIQLKAQQIILDRLSDNLSPDELRLTLESLKAEIATLRERVSQVEAHTLEIDTIPVSMVTLSEKVYLSTLEILNTLGGEEGKLVAKKLAAALHVSESVNTSERLGRLYTGQVDMELVTRIRGVFRDVSASEGIKDHSRTKMSVLNSVWLRVQSRLSGEKSRREDFDILTDYPGS